MAVCTCVAEWLAGKRGCAYMKPPSPADNDGTLICGAGNVQVRNFDEDRIVIHADEVFYHTDTGEIETRGNARVTIEKLQ